MTVTGKLVRVFRVDQQIRGLKGRLRSAEAFLGEQVRQLEEMTAKAEAIRGQLRQLGASASNDEGEMARIDVHIDELRERMNTAKTNKEYKALLTEVNTFKERRGSHEESALSQMEKTEALQAQLAELETGLAERSKVRDVASGERDQRADEIKDRLAELEAERTTLITDVPSDALSVYQELLDQRDDEAMGPIEIQDRKRHEFNCGSCMMSLPIETMSALLSHGGLTRCVSCGCILYLEENTREAMAPASSKR